MTTHTTTTDTLQLLRSGRLHGRRTLDLRGCQLAELPAEVLDLADTLEVLDVSNNALRTLPDGMGSMRQLHTLFASFNRFTDIPAALGRLPQLDTLGFKGNQIHTVAAGSLAPSLRWLILTDNQIRELPATLTDCASLQKLMLAGNRLGQLPPGMARLRNLELVRLAANAFEHADALLTDELLSLPRLAWLAFGGNPFIAHDETRAFEEAAPRGIAWSELTLRQQLGEGASGRIHAADWSPAGATSTPTLPVAVKLFKGTVTSDGWPSSEMAATLKAGRHDALVGSLGVLQGHPQGTHGLVLPRLSADWKALAAPPSMVTCSRDVYDADLRLPKGRSARMLHAARAAMEHLHHHGLMHGDLYAHNLLVNDQGQAVLSDFGAASLLPGALGAGRIDALKSLDHRALAILGGELQAISVDA